MFLAFVIIGMADLSTSFPEYAIHEYWLPWLSFAYIMLIIAPNYWKSNWLIFAACFTYFAVTIYLKYGYVSERFKLWMLAWIFYFVTASLLLSSKLTNLWAAILKNEKLVNETKKLLTIFPNGVIIHSGFTANKFQTVFSNEQFKSQILGIHRQLSLFESIEINFEQREDDVGNSISMNLKKLLKRHQHKIRGNEIVHQDKVKIVCHPSDSALTDNNRDDAAVERIFNIKSMKVEWNDKPCFMHVFVDTTDIVKLEEANNNIRCQKIMFTSASHEFRTPLNAITNSLKLIDGCLEDVVKVTDDLCHYCK